jgi:hypothetical protein
MRASPSWLKYSNTYYLFSIALARAERRVLSRSPSTPKSRCFRTPAPAEGAGVVRGSILIPMNPALPHQARQLSSRGTRDASMAAAFFWRRGRGVDSHDQSCWCYSMAVISAWSLPARTVSPPRFPSSSLASGEMCEIEPFAGSATSSPTMRRFAGVRL